MGSWFSQGTLARRTAYACIRPSLDTDSSVRTCTQSGTRRPKARITWTSTPRASRKSAKLCRNTTGPCTTRTSSPSAWTRCSRKSAWGRHCPYTRINKSSTATPTPSIPPRPGRITLTSPPHQTFGRTHRLRGAFLKGRQMCLKSWGGAHPKSANVADSVAAIVGG